MIEFWQGIGFVILAVILMLVLGKQNGEMTVLISLACCAGVGVLVLIYLKDVVDFVQRLQSVSNLDAGLLQTLLKAVGIGIVGEFAALICADAGNAAQSKAVQMLTSCAILWLSIPVFQMLLELIDKILGEL